MLTVYANTKHLMLIEEQQNRLILFDVLQQNSNAYVTDMLFKKCQKKVLARYCESITCIIDLIQ